MTHDRPPLLVRLTQRLEGATGLDGPVAAIEPAVTAAFGTGLRGALLRGEWLGHAIHPLMTDVPIGAWTSATVLDLFGGAEARPAARMLVGTGLLAAAPTAWTGWSEWTAITPRDKRVGLVHAAANGAAVAVYAASWLARRQGNHRSGARLALAGAALTGMSGYLGGHLTEARQVASHHPAYDEPAGPRPVAAVR